MSRAVLAPTDHIHSLKEMVGVDKVVNVGDRKKPSNGAIDKFIEIYLEIVKRKETSHK
ncbi:hypothetical protein KHA94_16450 [Bacillus sp. FJAT-49705]|uniref:Uncharacterized protein n=1 Tax=Cytobacillus citreus TaxID=2833586 RepID=A0ABS5NVG7_9BACI|nr:hypothetical protein [Cytobacillus citreus]MBS4191782.1 hypothetical protein [Cytobacillus citreus]